MLPGQFQNSSTYSNTNHQKCGIILVAACLPAPMLGPPGPSGPAHISGPRDDASRVLAGLFAR